MFAAINTAVRTYMRENPFFVNILIAVWTLMQSMFQLTWLLLGHYMYNCLTRPTSYDLAFLYLTYFYRDNCGDVYLGRGDSFLSETKLFWFMPIGNGTELYLFMKDVLRRGVFPDTVIHSARTNAYIQTSLVFESFWGFASVTLLSIGACLKIKNYWTILFSGPWLVVTGLNVFLDVVSAVHFGLDIRLLSSYTSWLKFIGVKNYEEFLKYNALESSKSLPALPSIVLVLLFSRFFVVWILNILCFMNVLNRYIELFQKSRPPEKRGRSSRLTCNDGQEIDLNSSEARIRNWQLFYGAIDSTSTLTSTCSSKTETKKKINNDDNLQLPSTSEQGLEYPAEDHKVNKVRIIKFANTYELGRKLQCEPLTIQENFFNSTNFLDTNPDIDAGRPSIDSTFSTYYCKFSEPNYPDVAGSASSKANPLLRSQLPWSYLGPKDVKNIDSNSRKQQFRIDANDEDSSHV